jgi:hypothetical protein
VLFGVLLAISVAGYAMTASFPSPLLPGYPGSAMFPRIALVSLGVFSAFGLARALLARGTGGPPLRFELAGWAAVVASLAAFAVVIRLLGTEIAAFGFVAGCLWFRRRDVVVPVVSGLLSVAFVYLVFVQLLSVHLPLLFLPRYLGGF